MKKRVQDFAIGLLLIMMAFWAGSQKDPLWGMAGFLPFFIVGSMIILRTLEKIRNKEE